MKVPRTPSLVASPLAKREKILPEVKQHTFYCQREDMENRIEELKNHLKADRTSCTSFRANQFRLFLHSCAFVLLQGLQQTLVGTELENAQVDTIRVRFLKIGARIKESVRRLYETSSSTSCTKRLLLFFAVLVRQRIMKVLEVFGTPEMLFFEQDQCIKLK